jgi:hypothetical protein
MSQNSPRLDHGIHGIMNAGQFLGREQPVGIAILDQRIAFQELTPRVVGVGQDLVRSVDPGQKRCTGESQAPSPVMAATAREFHRYIFSGPRRMAMDFSRSKRSLLPRLGRLLWHRVRSTTHENR